MWDIVDLTREQLASIAPQATLVLGFGAIEQHGPHLPFGTDFLVVDAVARGAAERAGRDASVVLAPAIPYGSSEHHLAVGGAVSITPSAFEAIARDLFASAAETGFRRIFVINGHGGNDQVLRVAAQVASARPGLAIAGGAYWTLAQQELREIMPLPLLVPGHAGRFETSLVRALRPDLELDAPERTEWELEDITPYWIEDRGLWTRIDGYSDSPAQGSAEEGRACLGATIAAIGLQITEFHSSTGGGS
jgi:creatinine amidohydrolase